MSGVPLGGARAAPVLGFHAQGLTMNPAYFHEILYREMSQIPVSEGEGFGSSCRAFDYSGFGYCS